MSGTACVGWSLAAAALAIASPGCDSTSPIAAPLPELIWSVERLQEGLLPTTPVIVDGGVLVASGSVLRRLDLQTGELRWQVDFGEVVGVGQLRLVADETAVYAWGIDKWAKAYNLENGDPLWNASLVESPATFFTTLIDGGDVLVLPVLNSVLSIAKATGSITGVVQLPPVDSQFGQVPNFAGLSDDGILCVPIDYSLPGSDPPGSLRQGLVYSIDVRNGDFSSVHELESVERKGVVFRQRANACVTDGTVHAVVTGDRVVGLDAETGLVVWTQDDLPTAGAFDGFAPGPASTDGTTLYVGSVKGNLYALELASGDVLWSASAGGYSFSNDLAVVEGDTVYVVNGAFGDLWIVDRNTGTVRGTVLPPPLLDDGFLSEPAVGNGYVVLVGYYHVYCYRML